MTDKRLHNPTAGEMLKEELLDEMGISQNELARRINVPPNRISDIIRGRRKITADTDYRLCTFFGFSQGMFLRLQTSWEMAEVRKTMKNEIAKIKPYKPLNPATA